MVNECRARLAANEPPASVRLPPGTAGRDRHHRRSEARDAPWPGGQARRIGRSVVAALGDPTADARLLVSQGRPVRWGGRSKRPRVTAVRTARRLRSRRPGLRGRSVSGTASIMRPIRPVAGRVRAAILVRHRRRRSQHDPSRRKA